MKKTVSFFVLASFGWPALGQRMPQYWTTTRGDGASTRHQLHLLRPPYRTNSIDQIEAAQSSPFGYRDGATDRAEHLYFGWENGVARHDLNGLNATLLIAGPAPAGVGLWRALAFDPTGDQGNGSLWVQNLRSPLIEVDLSGELLTVHPNNGSEVAALAFDDVDGRLWAQLAGSGDIIKVDTTTGVVVAGLGWPSAFPGASGLNGTHDGTRQLGATGTDQVGIYDIDGTLRVGPLPTPFGGSGIAVLNGPRCAGFICGDVNCDGRFDGGDIDAFFISLGDPGGGCRRPPCPCAVLCTADINGDGAVNGADIDPFFLALGALGPCQAGG